MTRILALCIGVLLTMGALATGLMAQERSETVIVTGTREAADAVINDFVAATTAPTRGAGKVPRWVDGVCPATMGLGPKYAAFVSRRVREVAAQAKAPVNADAKCRPNVTIVFTTQPQKLMDNIRRTSPMFLGYYDTSAQADALAQVKRPIQAWYVTQSRDVRGVPRIDSRNACVEIEVPNPFAPDTPIRLPCANAVNSAGSRLGDGVTGDFFHVLIVAEPKPLAGKEVGTLADYVALLALTQLAVPDKCQKLPTIGTLLAPDCGPPPDSLTASDLAYLEGLYRMNGGGTLRGQRDDIAYALRKTYGPPDGSSAEEER